MFIFTGNRREGSIIIKFRYDDEIYGLETRTCFENLQFGIEN